MRGFTRRRFRFIWRYLQGDVPWDSGIVPPEIVAWIETAESNGLSPGRALDLGCGTGTTSIFLAGRGWDVVGIDFAPNAIHQARRKAQAARLTGSATFHSADVSRLDFLNGVFDLAIDVGCLHGLDADQRSRYAAHLARLTRPGATYLLYAFQPRIRRGRQAGIDPQGVETLFAPAFTVLDVTLGEEVTTPVPSGWYTLRRTEAPA
jgi:SAM-dependent methyltransferase